MNYANIYKNLIEKSKSRGLNKNLVNFKAEAHHIIPKCMGGTDNEENLVLLSYREHFLAHLLLCKMYPTNISLAFSMHCMTRNNGARPNVKSLPNWAKDHHKKCVGIKTSKLWENNSKWKNNLIDYNKTRDTSEIKKKVSASLKLRNAKPVIAWKNNKVVKYYFDANEAIKELNIKRANMVYGKCNRYNSDPKGKIYMSGGYGWTYTFCELK